LIGARFSPSSHGFAAVPFIRAEQEGSPGVLRQGYFCTVPATLLVPGCVVGGITEAFQQLPNAVTKSTGLKWELVRNF